MPREAKLTLRPLETGEPEPGRRRTLWPTRFGTFEADQDFGRRKVFGTTTLSGPLTASVGVAAYSDGYGRFLKDGVPVTIAGRDGRIVRPGYGLRAKDRAMTITVGDLAWTVTAKPHRLVLRRDGQLIATSSAEAATLHKAATVEDAALVILLTVNGMWDGAALWARYLSRTGEGDC